MHGGFLANKWCLQRNKTNGGLPYPNRVNIIVVNRDSAISMLRKKRFVLKNDYFVELFKAFVTENRGYTESSNTVALHGGVEERISFSVMQLVIKFLFLCRPLHWPAPIACLIFVIRERLTPSPVSSWH